ncbi:ABC transporter permease [Couchioplanes caeruleus]|uniref:Putative ABC transport system permease protein n=1 Tax=Couchioplanes caeruleus TaxID=56438 RepID=A0A3N1GEN6_9ACTN|nr:ABC transporter permease [Couchioplanes caeruleus]ROP28641.1 putative ABC transport system permease protein [Couchioplanes caeruleus]
MPRFTLVWAELTGRPIRTLTGAVSLAIGLALFLSLQAYGSGYRQAARAPLSEIGTDIVAQREGDRPQAFEGAVFPHSAAVITDDQASSIAATDGVEATSRALIFWSFQDDDLVVTLGMDPAERIGPGRLSAGLRAGRFLQPQDSGVAVLDLSYAEQKQIKTGDTFTIAGQAFTVVGLVDTSRAGQIANANAYLPLADAQKITTSAGISGPTDVNMVFVTAQPASSEAVAREVAAALGKDSLITTPQSFDDALGSTFSLIDRFGLLVGIAALLVAAAGLARTVSANLAERRRDVAVMRAVGWPRRAVTTQLTAETAAITTLGLVLGVLGAVAVTWALNTTTVTVPVPWELSPTPHFLAGGARQLSLTVPMNASLDVFLIAAAALASLVAATLVSILAARRAAGIKPMEAWRVQ